MKFKTVINKEGTQLVIVKQNTEWFKINTELSLLELLTKTKIEISVLPLTSIKEEEYKEIIPFKPSSYRDFMLYEKHAIDSAMGFVKKYMPHFLPFVKGYKAITGRPFPMIKPKKRFYQHPIFYMGNHLNFISNNDSIEIPSYTKELDYELELAAVICKPLKNATVDEVSDAIGGFVILNDFSARDVQLSEMNSGFGPMKSKNFGNAISTIVVHKDALIDQVENLNVKVTINDKTISKSNTQGKLYSFQEAIAYASWEEQLHPGELFGSGTIPGCTGIENGKMLHKGDTIKLEVEGIGTLSNHVI